MQSRPLASDAGIAIGPILFIIAVLGILAAAIAAGSGSFTTSTSSEGNRAKAAALIDIGQTLKIGFDRIIGNGTAFTSVIIDPDETTNDYDLFSPTGGGVGAPARTLAEAPGTDEWHYPYTAIPKLCSMSHPCRLAVIKVSPDVCDVINQRTANLAAGYASGFNVDQGDFASTSTSAHNASNWPAELQGKPIGCVYNSNTNTLSAGTFFYQVLGLD